MAKKDKDEDEKADDAADKKKGGDGEEGADGEGGEESAKGGLFSGKKKFIFIGVGVVVLLGGIVGALFATGVLGGGKKADPATAEAGAHGEAADAAHGDGKEPVKLFYYDLGDIIVNLSGEGKRPNFLKIKVSLELDNEKDKLKMDQIKPRILDNFQAYLRELRIEDLKGSAGIYRLREELLLRVTEAAHPARVRDVLFQEMLVQ